MAFTLTLVVVLFASALATQGEIHYVFTLMLSGLAGLFVVRLFIIQHDCGHGAFSKCQRTNDNVGRFLSLFTMTPYSFWKRDHNKHHATSGNLDKRGFGDIMTMTVTEYNQLTPFKRFLYRAYRNPIVMFGIGPTYQFLLRYRLPMSKWDLEPKNRNSIIMTNLAIAALVGSLCVAFGASFLLVWIPAIFVAATTGVWLFFVQHQFDETYWKRDGDWDFAAAGLFGCSHYDLPRALHWATGYIGYHHVHHLASRIPNYRLAECHNAISEMGQATKLSIMESIRCVRLSLWCESRGRLVSFRDAKFAVEA